VPVGGSEVAPAPGRTLSGEKSRRIVEAMRESVAEVGIAESTFDRVAAKAGVSRGLLHYYFGTKERLLVDVIRRDTEIRVGVLGSALRRADSLDGVIAAFFDAFTRTIAGEVGYVYMVSELFVAGRHNREILDELGRLYGTARTEFAGILREKEAEGVVRLRYPAEDVLTFLFTLGDGASVQRLAQPGVDFSGADRLAYETVRFLLWSEDEA
jgi:AcrR family transcriptional regulator